MNRRHTDLPGHEPETREATLEVLVDHYRRLREQGSDNFRRYRARATWLFIALALVSSFAVYLAWSNGRVAQRNLAEQVRAVTYANCVAGNDFRASLRRFVDMTVRGSSKGDRLRDLAATSFAGRDCERVAETIKTP